MDNRATRQPDRRAQETDSLTALGLPASEHLRVDPQSLAACYYDYLAAHLQLPFVACYPVTLDAGRSGRGPLRGDRTARPTDRSLRRFRRALLPDPQRPPSWCKPAVDRVDRPATQQKTSSCWATTNIGSGTGGTGLETNGNPVGGLCGGKKGPDRREDA